MGSILVIDDDVNIRALVAAHLTHAGHSVRLAENGEDGVNQAGAERPDLIILDINMPVMDGTRVMKVLRGDTATADVPVIALSALAASDIRDDMHRLGCDAYVVKPIDFDVLNSAVQKLIAT